MPTNINRVIYILTGADILLTTAFGFIMPLFAIFVTNNIVGAGVTTVGFFTAIYWISKSTFQIPVAWILDKIGGEADDLYAMITGYFLSAVVAFSYIFASEVSHIYILAVLIGLADALGVPSYLSIFSRHLDHARENIEWTFRSVGVGIAAAGAGALAGILVERFGFNSVFILGGVLSLIAAASLLLLKPHLKTRDGHVSILPHVKTKPHQKSVL